MSSVLPYLISGTDDDGYIWVVRSDDHDTALHVADMFRESGHTRVTAVPVDYSIPAD
jgi:hypothetical protein